MACVLLFLVGVLAVFFGNKALYVEIVSGVIVLTAILAITY